MALQRAKSSDLPVGAKILDRDEAYRYIFSEIYKHQPLSDVWALRYGGAIVGVLASISGVLMLRHFRKQLGLTTEALFSSHLPCTFIPCLGSFLCHMTYSAPPVVLQEPYCALCLELRSACAQVFTGFVWPYALGMTSAAMTASKLGSYVPSMVHPREFWSLSIRMASANKGPSKFAGLLVLNVLGAMLVIHTEGMQMFTFNKRIEIRKTIAEND